MSNKKERESGGVNELECTKSESHPSLFYSPKRFCSDENLSPFRETPS